jgi:hypothetical protein
MLEVRCILGSLTLCFSSLGPVLAGPRPPVISIRIDFLSVPVSVLRVPVRPRKYFASPSDSLQCVSGRFDPRRFWYRSPYERVADVL